jgi:hypothetical protein
MRWLLFVLLVAAGVGSVALVKKYKKSTTVMPIAKKPAITAEEEWRIEAKRLAGFAASLKEYARAHKYNTRYGFIADMGLPSGRKRLFIYDYKVDAVVQSGLVAHGSGKTLSDEIQFSNEPGSLCTSLGKYKIGASYNGKFGLAYKLHGLDDTNNKAFERAVVLHAHSCVPDAEVEPEEICLSWGCPTVSPRFLDELTTYLKAAEKPILLWVIR